MEETIYQWNVPLMLEYVDENCKIPRRFRQFLMISHFLSFHLSNRIAQSVLKLLELIQCLLEMENVIWNSILLCAVTMVSGIVESRFLECS